MCRTETIIYFSQFRIGNLAFHWTSRFESHASGSRCAFESSGARGSGTTIAYPDSFWRNSFEGARRSLFIRNPRRGSTRGSAIGKHPRNRVFLKINRQLYATAGAGSPGGRRRDFARPRHIRASVFHSRRIRAKVDRLLGEIIGSKREDTPGCNPQRGETDVGVAVTGATSSKLTILGETTRFAHHR